MCVSAVWCDCVILPDLTGVTLGNVRSISDDVAGSATETYEDLKPGTYSIKFVDSGGRESIDAAYIEFTKADLDNVENVSTQTEDPSFPGTKTNLVDSSTNELELDFQVLKLRLSAPCLPKTTP